ncbi:MAG TPA: hypothetical protein ENN79_11880, partial [Desulfobacteraceae bacterium]|nr:hypothetical protein [Desulfobacteraceae bacterium]
MKKLLFLACAITSVAVPAGTVVAESDITSHDVTITVNEVALIGVSENSVSFTIGGVGGAAGDPFYIEPNDGSTNDVGYDNSSYLNYTSIVDGSGKQRIINVYIDDANNIPAGYNLYVKAAADAPTGESSGSGDLGSAVKTRIELNDADTTAKTIVEEIGSGYTGQGADNGVNLIYELEMVDPDSVASLHADSSAKTTV